MKRRIQAGNHVRVIRQTHDGVELESASRLRPGEPVDLVLDRVGLTGASARAALVVSWSVARLSKDGPVYRGLCLWQ
jgi:hypothetical protein